MTSVDNMERELCKQVLQSVVTCPVGIGLHLGLVG